MIGSTIVATTDVLARTTVMKPDLRTLPALHAPRTQQRENENKRQTREPGRLVLISSVDPYQIPFSIPDTSKVVNSLLTTRDVFRFGL
mmetsp:Transcript_1303/g.3312  ORF Transcript_1303/g.3312 Transcript_1303/m.3312 type:complete len:88 (+) Transcript_1303:107-370(+)